jgi:hypothetical protein
MIRVPIVLLLLLPLLPVQGFSQRRSSLDEVETLIAQGRIHRAREVLEDWWDEQGPRVSRIDRQRSLWFRARLTVDPSMAELDLRRLVLEFPGGTFSDDALLRLAQNADLQGDLRQAHGHFSALVRGYPSSPYGPVAEAWLRDRGPEVDALGPEPMAEVEPPQEQAPLAGRGDVAVQLGAFRNLDGARSLAGRLRAAGFEPRLVRVGGDGLIRVRVGRFGTRDAAESLLRDLDRAGFDATVARDAQSEERIG